MVVLNNTRAARPGFRNIPWVVRHPPPEIVAKTAARYTPSASLFPTRRSKSAMRTEFGMRCPEFDWHPARRRLRHFAWLTALFLAVLSWAGGTPTWSLSLRLAAALLFAIGTVLPGVLRWPYMALLLIVYLFSRL